MSISKEELEVKHSIKALLTSSACVSTIKSLHKEYIDLIGQPIPYLKFEYKSLEHFLKSVPDVCTVTGSGWYAEVHPVVTEKIAHINEMVTRQKVNNRNRRFSQPRRKFTMPEPSVNSATFRSRNGPKMNSNLSHQTPIKDKYVKKVNGATTSAPTIDSPGVTAGPRSITVTGTSKCYSQPLIGDKNKAKTQPHIEENASPFIELKFQTLSCKSNIQTHQIPSNNKQQERDEAVQVSAQVSRKIEETQSSHISPSFDTIKETIEEDISNVPQKVQDNLKLLIAQYPDGIWVSDLPTAYMKLFKRVLFYKDYGYVNLVDMCIALNHIFHYIRPGHDDFKLYDKRNPFPASTEKFWTMASCSDAAKMPSHIRPLPDLDWSDVKGRLPNDVFAYGDTIPNQFLPEGTKVDGVLDVVIVEIYDPSKFWFYLGNSLDKAPLDTLMDQLQYFYNDASNAQEYAVPPIVVKEGLYCVQIIVGEYHRAKVVRVLPEEESVRLLFIDYGSVCKVPIKGLCFLRAEFATLPAQAIRCRLANIAPVAKGITWSRASVDGFREMVNRKDTKIKISYVDWQEEFVCVFLADITDPNNVHYVNEKLVKEGHAVWCGEKQLDPLAIPIFNSKVKNLHLFPTYLELEYGLAPNANEMYYLQEMLVPLQFCIPQYFEPLPEALRDFKSKRKDFENSFYKSVKRNHRRFIPLNTHMSDLITKSVKIDLSIFGKLRDKIAEFSTSPGLPSEEEDLSSKKSVDGYAIVRNKRRNISSLQLSQDNRELTEKIIRILEDFNISDTGLDLDSLPATKSRSRSTSCSENSSSLQNVKREPVIRAQSETMRGYPNGVQIDNDCLLHRSSDLNTFDNPTEFPSECSASNGQALRHSNSPVSPETFFSILQSQVDNDYLFDDCKEDKITQTTDKSSAESWNSNNPFREFFCKPVEHAISWETDVSSNQESNMKCTASHSSSLETLLSSKSDYKEFVPSCVDNATATNTVDGELHLQPPVDDSLDGIADAAFTTPLNHVPELSETESERYENEVRLLDHNERNLGRSTYRAPNKITKPPNPLFTAPVSYVTQRLESESRTAVSQVRMAPAIFTRYPQGANGSGFPSLPQYPQWSDGTNYPSCPVMFEPKIRPPPGFMPISYQVDHSQHIYSNNVHSAPFYQSMHPVVAYSPATPIGTNFLPISVIQNEQDFYTAYNQRFYTGNSKIM